MMMNGGNNTRWSYGSGRRDAVQGNSETILRNSASGHARAVRVRTLPSAPSANANLAMLSPLDVSRKITMSLSPDVRYTCLISTTTFLASSRAACARLGASLTARIPWSVQWSDSMNVSIRPSLELVVGRIRQLSVKTICLTVQGLYTAQGLALNVFVGFDCRSRAIELPMGRRRQRPDRWLTFALKVKNSGHHVGY